MKYMIYINKGVQNDVPLCKIIKIMDSYAEARYCAMMLQAEVAAIEGNFVELEEEQEVK